MRPDVVGFIAVLALACGGTTPLPVVANQTQTLAEPTPDEPPSAAALVIEQTRDGGSLELRGDRGAALDEANHKMALHCGRDSYQIVSEAEVVGGAWRVEYACAR